jgi:hypothetical protein
VQVGKEHYETDRTFMSCARFCASFVKKPRPFETRWKLVKKRKNPNKINGFTRVASDEVRCRELAPSGFLSPVPPLFPPPAVDWNVAKLRVYQQTRNATRLDSRENLTALPSRRIFALTIRAFNEMLL